MEIDKNRGKIGLANIKTWIKFNDKELNKMGLEENDKELNKMGLEENDTAEMR